MKENIIETNLRTDLIEEEKNNSDIIKNEIKEKKTKKEFINMLKSILNDDQKENEYLNQIKNNPSSLFETINEEKLKQWEEKLISKDSLLIKSHKSDEKIFSKLDKLEIKEQHIIKNDSQRTRSRESKLLPDFKKILFQALSYYCYKSKAIYKQGLNEIFGPLILLKNKIKNLPLYYIINLGAALVDKFLPNYFYEESIYSLKSAIALYQVLLKYHEPTVFNKLEASDVKPELYTMNWFINYQSGKFPLNMFYYFWDKMISINDPLFIQFFIVALIKIHRELIINSDINYLPALISNLPIKSTSDIDNIIKKALELRNKTPYSFRLWANKIGFLRKNYKDININYEKYQPESFMAMPIFPSEILYIMYKDKIKCIDSRCKNYIKSLLKASPQLELKKRKEKNINEKIKDKNKSLRHYNINMLELIDQHHICEKCTMKIEKDMNSLLFDLRIKQFNEIDNKTGSLPGKINITQEELKSLDFDKMITERYLNERGNYHFIFLTSETDNFSEFEKNYYKDNLTLEDQRKALFGFINQPAKEKELNINEAKKDLNLKDTLKLKEYDNMKKSITSMIKNNFPYISYVYGGYEQVHKECLRFKMELIDHEKDKCFLCQNKKNNLTKNDIGKNKEEEKNMLYEHLWAKKKKINYDNLDFFTKNPNVKIHLGILKEYKSEAIEEDKIQILILQLYDKFELELYKFNKEKQYHDFENTMMILDRKNKKEYYDLGKEDDDNENNKSLELTLLEKISVNNIISISPNKKAANIVNILIKDEKSKKLFNIKKDNNRVHNIVIDFSSDKDSKNFITSFKSLINLYKSNLRNK